jgi:hypothetical protein
VRCCPPGRIEEQLCYVVVEAARGWAGLFTLGRLVLLRSSLGPTQPVWARDELATLRPNCRHVLDVGATRVPWVEFACCRGVGCDSDMMDVRPCRAALRLLSESSARACRLLVCLHGMGNRHPTRRSERVHMLGCATWYGLCLGRRWRVLV